MVQVLLNTEGALLSEWLQHVLPLGLALTTKETRGIITQKIIKILSSGAYDFSLAHTFCMPFKPALHLSKDF